MENMVPYRQEKWYHILLVNGTIFFSNISLFQLEEGYDSFSILAFFVFQNEYRCLMVFGSYVSVRGIG